MEKRRLLIFEVLGIALRSSDRVFFIRTIVIFSIVMWCFTFLSVWVCEHVQNKYLSFALLGFIAVIIGYFFVSYTLSSLFKTNHFLDILLKDTLHELNIPLSVIKANLQMLQSSEEDSKKIKRLLRIEQASHDLYELYQEVDYYIKKEIRRDVRESFFLDEVVMQVIEKQKELYEGVEIYTQGLHVNLFADKHGFAKVISNLLHNAIKYNVDTHPIHITYQDTRLCIEDQGIGMSESELFLVFNRYYQADTAHEGYGIGLSLVKAYCDECKIKLRIDSQKGRGTKVILDIAYLLYKT